jgi:hypothetical protein
MTTSPVVRPEQPGAADFSDLSGVLRGPVFEPLHDVAYFRQFELDPLFHTLTWPNGADVAPEFLHDSLTRST